VFDPQEQSFEHCSQEYCHQADKSKKGCEYYADLIDYSPVQLIWSLWAPVHGNRMAGM
jgi:hypothetical protein